GRDTKGWMKRVTLAVPRTGVCAWLSTPRLIWHFRQHVRSHPDRLPFSEYPDESVFLAVPWAVPVWRRCLCIPAGLRLVCPIPHVSRSLSLVHPPACGVHDHGWVVPAGGVAWSKEVGAWDLRCIGLLRCSRWHGYRRQARVAAGPAARSGACLWSGAGGHARCL